MSQSEPTVFIVDDDPGVLKGLRLLVKSVKMNVQTFSAAQDFLDSYDPVQPGCLVLDVRMPDIGGLEVQRILQERDIDIPVIILTGYADVQVAVRAMKQGAIDFLEKPFSGEGLLALIRSTVAKDAQNRQKQAAQESMRAQLMSLTPRQRQVMDLIVAGKRNKVIALELGVSQKTVEFHRANIMRKMGVDSATELVRLVAETRIMR